MSKSIWYNRGQLVRIIGETCESLKGWGVTHSDCGALDDVYITYLDGSTGEVNTKCIYVAGGPWPSIVLDSLERHATESLIAFYSGADHGGSLKIVCSRPPVGAARCAMLVLVSFNETLVAYQVAIDFLLHTGKFAVMRLNVSTLSGGGADKILPLILKHCSPLLALAAVVEDEEC